MKMIDREITDYVEREILPRYDAFDKAHQRDHIRQVIERSIALAERMDGADPDMVYVVAAFHDLGLVNGRENHHIDSGRILEADPMVRRRFTPEQRRLMREAVEDHRASGKTPPRSIYGLIVAEADRLIDPVTIIRRTIQYGLANYPELDREAQYRRMLDHLNTKYGPDGYLKIWIPDSDNARRLLAFHALIADQKQLRQHFTAIYSAETAE